MTGVLRGLPRGRFGWLLVTGGLRGLPSGRGLLAMTDAPITSATSYDFSDTTRLANISSTSGALTSTVTRSESRFPSGSNRDLRTTILSIGNNSKIGFENFQTADSSYAEAEAFPTHFRKSQIYFAAYASQVV